MVWIYEETTETFDIKIRYKFYKCVGREIAERHLKESLLEQGYDVVK